MTRFSVGESPQFRARQAPLSCWLLIALVSCSPYLPMLHDHFPIRAFGYSLFVTVMPTVMLAVTFVIAAAKRPALLGIPVLMSLCCICVAALRIASGISDRSFFQNMVDLRYLALVPLFIAVSLSGMSHQSFGGWVPKIIIFNGVVAGLVGILYSIGWFHYRVQPAEGDLAVYLAGTQTRSSGLFAGPNFYGNFLVIPLLLLRFNSSLPKSMRVGAGCIILAGIVTSSSRNALFSSFLVLASMVLEQRRIAVWKRGVQVLALGFMLVLVQHIGWSSATEIKTRITEDTPYSAENRLNKARIGVTALQRNTWTLLAGAYASDLSLSESGEYQFSDNSFIMVVVSAGLPVGLLFFGLVATRMRMRSWCGHRLESMTMVGIVTSTLLLNNAILWDVWLLYIAISYAVIFQIRSRRHCCAARTQLLSRLGVPRTRLQKIHAGATEK